MTQEVTIVPMSAASADEYNDEVLEPDASVVTTGWLHQTQRDESTVGANTQIETWVLYLPPDTTIGPADRVTVDGDTYEVFGPPWEAHNPRLRRVTHIEVTVKKVV